jgi:plasmid rolling circle replication initiator protein Rep
MALVMSWIQGLEKRSLLMEFCGTQMELALPEPDGNRKVVGANLCRDRLCPNCAYLRSKKVFGQVSKVMNAMPEDLVYIFATFTIRNCKGEDLTDALDTFRLGWQKLILTKEFKPVKGWFRALEITHNRREGTYHPHYHTILAVQPSYFGKQYVKQARWVQLWRECCGLDYDPSVDVRRVKAGDQGVLGATKEVAKYTLKLSSILAVEDLQECVEPVKVLSYALKGRRLVGFGGLMRAIHKRLNLGDPEDGDLTEKSELRPDVAYVIESWRWNVGISDWELVGTKTKAQWETDKARDKLSRTIKKAEAKGRVFGEDGMKETMEQLRILEGKN